MKMNCNCKEEIETQLIEDYKSIKENQSNIVKSLDFTGYKDDEDLGQVPVIPYTINVDIGLTNGGWRPDSSKKTILAAYCPHCGTATGVVTDKKPEEIIEETQEEKDNKLMDDVLKSEVAEELYDDGFAPEDCLKISDVIDNVSINYSENNKAENGDPIDKSEIPEMIIKSLIESHGLNYVNDAEIQEPVDEETEKQKEERLHTELSSYEVGANLSENGIDIEDSIRLAKTIDEVGAAFLEIKKDGKKKNGEPYTLQDVKAIIVDSLIGTEDLIDMFERISEDEPADDETETDKAPEPDKKK